MNNEDLGTDPNRPRTSPAWIFAWAGALVFIIVAFLLQQQSTVDKEQQQHRDAIMLHAVPRSGQWKKVRADYIAKHPACELCGYKGDGLQVHHCQSFHEHPELELDPDNLVTLCGPEHHNCHLIFGHLFNYKLTNSHVREDIATMKQRVIEAIQKSKKEVLK